jgi:hypothetical protein
MSFKREEARIESALFLRVVPAVEEWNGPLMDREYE